MRKWIGVLAMAVPCALTAQSGSRARAGGASGSIEGDVYLVVQSGDIRKAAASSVSLVRRSPDVGAAIDSTCAEGKKLYAASTQAIKAIYTPGLAHDDSATTRADSFTAANADRLMALIRAATVTESGTGMNAHYRFAAVKPGAYYLWSMYRLGDATYRWLVPVDVASGEALSRDLDNKTAEMVSPRDPVCYVLDF